MRKITFFKTMMVAIVMIVVSANCSAQIAAWDFTGIGSSTIASTPATTFNANLVSTSSANSITRGAGAPWSTGANSWRTVGFKNEGISTSNTDYFQITLSPNSGFTLSLSTIDAKCTGTQTYVATAGVSTQFAYSLDGTTFTLIGSPQVLTGTVPLTLTQIDLTGISALQNVSSGTSISLRFYASGQTTTGGWGFYSSASGQNGLAIGGSLNAVVSTGLTEAQSSLQISVVNKNILFPAISGEIVEIFNTFGQRLIYKQAVEGQNIIPVSAKGVVLVKVGNRSAKVLL